MKVLLINPPCREPYAIPLGLGYIGSVLRNDGHQVEVLDINGFGYSKEDVIGRLNNTNYDCVGIGGLSSTYGYVKWIAAQLKKIRPGAPVIAGNMVSTANPRFLLENTEVDIAVDDEGEITCLELCRALENSGPLDKVDGIFYKENGNICKTFPRKRIEDLNSLPFPAWDLFPMDIYVRNVDYYTYGLKSATISLVRGCPYNCIYCSRPFRNKVTHRSADSVIKEIKELKKRYGVGYLTFTDDLFMANKKRVHDFCRELAKENLDIKWAACGRVNLVDEEILLNMKMAGCIAVDYGFESGSQEILDIMGKGVKVRQAEEAVRVTRKVGLKVVESFMFGMIGETEETIAETVDFITRMKLPTDRLLFTTAYPGTVLYQKAKEMGRLPKDEESYMLSLGEMYKKMLVNMTEFSDKRLIELKEGAEASIKAKRHLSLKIKILFRDWNWRWRMMRAMLKDQGVWVFFRHLMLKLLGVMRPSPKNRDIK